MNQIKVGKIVSVVGLKGELKVYPYTDDPERFSELKTVYAGGKLYEIEKVRYQKNIAVLKLAGIDDRTEAEKHREEFLTIDKSEIKELPEGSYYIFDLIGISVIDEAGVSVGTLSDVIQNSAQDIYEIEMEDKSKFLIPAVGEFILDINMDKREMRVRLIEGLKELNR